MILTKEIFQSLKSQLLPLQREYVELSDGYGVYVAELTGSAAIKIGSTGDRVSPADWVAACCVDEEGNPVFEKEEVLQMPVAMFNALVEATLRLNGMAQGTEAVDTAEKNFEEAES